MNTKRIKPVFLHGWGQSASAWFRQRDSFGDACFLNLPGHGGTPETTDWVTWLAGRLPDAPFILIGWSLGGMLALKVAAQANMHQNLLRGLVLVGTTPCFASRNDWPHGCAPQVLEGFQQGIEAAEAVRQRAMERFFALMLHGDALARSEYRALARQAVDRRRPPTPTALKQGLLLLQTMDLRHELGEVRVPTLVIHGENDAVVPPGAGRYLAEHIDDATWLGLPGCGHAPQMTAKEFNNKLEAWCHWISTTR